MPQVTMVIKVTWEFPTPITLRAETHAGPHVKCPLLLPDMNQNWNVSLNFSKTREFQIS
jgi:hypothetical protein